MNDYPVPYTGIGTHGISYLMCDCGEYWWRIEGDPDPATAYYDHYDTNHRKTDQCPPTF